jgi:hypothetical protein
MSWTRFLSILLSTQAALIGGCDEPGDRADTVDTYRGDTCSDTQPNVGCPCDSSQLPRSDYQYCCVGGSLTGWDCGGTWNYMQVPCESWNETCPYCPPCPEGWTL